MASHDFNKGFRDRNAAPSFAKAREEAARTHWWHVSPEGEIREATGADSPPFDWSAFSDRADAERVAADRKRWVALYPESFGKPRVPAFYLISPAGQIEVVPQNGGSAMVAPEGWEVFTSRLEAVERAHARKKGAA